MAKKRQIKRKAKTLAAKKVRSAEEKGVKGGLFWTLPTFPSGGGGAGKASFEPFSIPKSTDKASP